MKKLIFIFLSLITFFSVGCTDFADTPGKSVWSEGMWIAPWMTGIGAAIFAWKAWKAHKSGSYIVENGRITDKDGGKIPIYQIGWFYFAVGLTIATVFIILNVISNR